MPLPRQVREKMDEVEAIEKQLSGESEKEVDKKTKKKAEPKKPAEEVEVAEDPKDEQPAGEQDEKPPEAEPEVEKPKPEAQEKVKKEEKAKPDEEVDYWKQKYRTLQGMYDKEVPQLHSRVKELETKLNEALSARKKEEKDTNNRLVTDDDVQTFGEDLIEVQRKVAREVSAEFKEELEALRRENAELKQTVGDTRTEIKQGSFKSELLRLVPDFTEVDQSPEWFNWLDEYDPILRAPRRAVAARAFQEGDAEGVAHYVRMFKKSQAADTPEPAATKQTQKTKDELERQIQPSRSTASTTPASSKGKTYSNSDVQRMFQKIAQLHSTGKFDEAKKLEAEIDSAYTQGRVTA